MVMIGVAEHLASPPFGGSREGVAKATDALAGANMMVLFLLAIA